MNITLEFEDLFSVKQDLIWEFRDTDIRMDINILRTIILNSFHEAADTYKLSEMEPFSGSKINIRVLLRSVGNERILAYFDLTDFHDNNEFSFRLYADVLYPVIKSGSTGSLKCIWVHEIMHMIDYRELLKNIELFRRKKEKTPERTIAPERLIRKDNHILLLQLVMKYRNEGIATLCEYINGYDIRLCKPEDAADRFREIIYQSLPLILSTQYDPQSYQKFYKQIVDPTSYSIGAGVVLQGLLKKYPDSPELKQINACLAGECLCDICINDKLLEMIRSFKSFDFIQYCFDQDSVYKQIFYLSRDYTENLEVFEGFFALLKRLAGQKDKAGFIAVMKNLMGYPLAGEEIREHYSLMVTTNDIPDEIREKTVTLYNYYLAHPGDEVTQWALTYLFDDQDLIDDSLDYFGYLDDVAVLNTAMVFIH